MKWLVLIAFAALAGAWVSYLKRDRKGIVHTGILFGFLTFVVAPWHLIIAPFAIPVWAGYVKGWEVSLLDTLAVGLLLSRPGVGHKTPMLVPLVVYLLASLLSVPLAAFPTYAIAYPIQLLRVILIFVAVSRIASYPDGAKSVYVGLVLGLTFQAGLAIFARLGGAIQTGGSFGHQNLLGFATHMVLLPSFALVMGKRWLKWSLLGTAAGAIIVILTASRATIFIAALGIMITYCVAAAANWNQRKAVFGLVTVLLLGIATPFAASSLERRFEAQGGNGSVFAEDLERTEFENAAKMRSKCVQSAASWVLKPSPKFGANS